MDECHEFLMISIQEGYRVRPGQMRLAISQSYVVSFEVAPLVSFRGKVDRLSSQAVVIPSQKQLDPVRAMRDYVFDGRIVLSVPEGCVALQCVD